MYQKQITLLLVLALCLLTLQGCNEEKATESAATEVVKAASDTSGEYAKVNDVVITKNDFEQFAKAKRDAQPEVSFSDVDITDEMIATELLRQEAVNAGISERTDIIEQIKRQENNILINTLMTEKFATLSFTDDALKVEYDRLVGQSSANEFKARHILLPDEDTAKAIIEELKAGADFAELAKQKSQGPSAPSGGDLGWFKAETMVPPFAAAVAELQKGSFTDTPVKTRFGYHVISLEDTRTVEQPAFEDVKQDIQRNLTRKKIEEYVDELESKATIVKPESGVASSGSAGTDDHAGHNH